MWPLAAPEGRILAGYDGFSANISFTFQAVKTLFTHYTYLSQLGLFCKFLRDFGVCLGINSISQRVGKIYANEKFGRFDVVLKLDFEV